MLSKGDKIISYHWRRSGVIKVDTLTITKLLGNYVMTDRGIKFRRELKNNIVLRVRYEVDYNNVLHYALEENFNELVEELNKNEDLPILID